MVAGMTKKRKRMDSRFRGNDKEDKDKKRKRMDSRFRGNDKEDKDKKRKTGFPLSRE